MFGRRKIGREVVLLGDSSEGLIENLTAGLRVFWLRRTKLYIHH